jgi:hypothetical protein
VLVQDAERDVGQQRGEDAPLGVPVMVSWVAPSWVRMPPLQKALISARTRLSAIRRRTRASSAVWSMVSKQAVMSLSTTHS